MLFINKSPYNFDVFYIIEGKELCFMFVYGCRELPNCVRLWNEIIAS